MKWFAFLLAFILALPAMAQDASQIRKKHYNLEKSLAIAGYDPVAYFKLNRAVKGSREFSVSHQGVTYQFASAQHRDEFRKSPAAYEPQYGGWCAYAMGKNGDKVDVDPETFKVTGGKLFLFYNKFFNNTLTAWNKDETALHRSADVNWKKIYH